MAKEKAGNPVNTEVASYRELARKLIAEIPSSLQFEKQENLWDELMKQHLAECEVLPLLSTDIGLEYKARIVAIFLAPSEISHMPFKAPRLMPTHPTPRRELVGDIPAELLSFTAKLVVGALKLGFNSLVGTAVELLCRLEPGTEDADKLYTSIPLAYTSEFGEFGYHGYMILMAKVGERQVPQIYKEMADAVMRERIIQDWHGDPMVWYARTLEILMLDTPYESMFFASQIQFVIRNSKLNGKKYEDVFGPHNGVFARIYHFLVDESWQELRLQFIAFAKGYIEAWAMEEDGHSECWTLLKIAEDANGWDPKFSAKIRELVNGNLASFREAHVEHSEREKKVADILSRMK